ncbi:MAG TPA: phosphoserine phosphatase SerB [Vulgatibacter sp.]|nr:phosphoserine phosphatase SerB [Vulgatibacter sp.]
MSRPRRFVVTCVHPGAAGSLAPILAGEEILRGAERKVLSPGTPEAIEWRAELGEVDAPAARARLFERARAEGFDAALQLESIHRQPKRLAVFDMDSTLIRIEVIDELARAHGVVEEVSRITEQAMRGELDFAQSLTRRVALLAGLRVETLDRVAASLPLNDGAERLVRGLKSLGVRVAVASGGFSLAARALEARLGLDGAWSNALESKEGRLTGRLEGPIVDAARKAEILGELAAGMGLDLDATMAVGDGANDRPMVVAAGLGVAFRAKAALREAADATLEVGGLDRALHFLGLDRGAIDALVG